MSNLLIELSSVPGTSISFSSLSRLKQSRPPDREFQVYSTVINLILKTAVSQKHATALNPYRGYKLRC